MATLLQQFKERNIWRVLVAYPSVSFVLLQAVEFLRNNYGLDSRFLTASLIVAIVLFPAAVIWNWRHGEAGQQAFSRTEVGSYAVSIVASVLAVGWYWSNAPTDSNTGNNEVARVRTIAVMPFANAGDDSAIQYLCDGIAESLINWLATIPNVKVESKTASFRLREHWEDTRKLAKELGVDTVLNGTLAMVNGRIVLSASLIDTNDESQLWGERLTPPPNDDVIEIERSIVDAIKAGLRLKVSDDSLRASGGTDNAEAYHHYLRGHWLIQSTNRKTVIDGLNELREAIQIDPKFARAYADIADTLSQSISYAVLVGDDELRGEARTAGLTAVALAPDLAEAHTALATVHQYFNFDWQQTDAAYEAAVALNPQSPGPYHRYTDYLVLTMRLDKAAEMASRAIAIDPLDSSSMHAVGLVKLIAGDFPGAAKAFGEWNRFHPDSRWSYVKHALALSLNGQCDAARAQIERLEDLTDGNSFLLRDAWTAWGFKVCGDAEHYDKLKLRIEATRAANSDYIDFGYVYILALEGDVDGVIDMLRYMIDIRDPLIVFAKVPGMDHLGFGTSNKLSNDPRYIALLDEIGFPPRD